MAVVFPRSEEPAALVVQSMRMAAGLTVLKVVAGAASGSLSVLSSALDSLLDITASAVNYVSLHVSGRPPDPGHPYGHGKAEALAGLFQGAFIAAGGLALLGESVRRVFSGAAVRAGPVALTAMGVSLLASAVHAARLKRTAGAHGSTVMKTESAHFAMDVLTNGAVIGALAAVRWTGSPAWDMIISAGVTVYILKQAVSILRDCAQELMDSRLPPDISARVEDIIRAHHPAVVGFHNFRARKSGGRAFIDFHIDIRGVAGFKEAHDITESLIDHIKDAVPGADVVVHYDPEGER